MFLVAVGLRFSRGGGVFSWFMAGIPLFMSLVFLGIGLLLGFFMLASLCGKTIWVDRDGLHWRTTFLGLTWSSLIPSDRVRGFEPHRSGSFGSKPFFSLRVSYAPAQPSGNDPRRTPRTHTLVGEIESRAEAEWLARELTRRLDAR
jgi:hypothetical protein